jgi:hypothetical protein
LIFIGCHRVLSSQSGWNRFVSKFGPNEIAVEFLFLFFYFPLLRISELLFLFRSRRFSSSLRRKRKLFFTETAWRPQFSRCGRESHDQQQQQVSQSKTKMKNMSPCLLFACSREDDPCQNILFRGASRINSDEEVLRANVLFVKEK